MFVELDLFNGQIRTVKASLDAWSALSLPAITTCDGTQLMNGNGGTLSGE